MELNKIYNQDCIVGAKSIESNSVDLIILDPPYKMTKRGKSCRPNWMANNMGENLFKGELPSTSSWMKEAFRILKPGTHLYIFTNTISIQEYMNEAAKAGFKLHNIIAVIKDTGMPNRWYYKQCELVLFFRKGKAKPINDYTSRDNVKVKMPKQSDGKIHITQKPVDLIEKLITNSSNIGETVVDFFMGSATTAIASLNTSRNFIGFELDGNYFQVANERIANHKNGMGLTIKTTEPIITGKSKPQQINLFPMGSFLA